MKKNIIIGAVIIAAAAAGYYFLKLKKGVDRSKAIEARDAFNRQEWKLGESFVEKYMKGMTDAEHEVVMTFFRTDGFKPSESEYKVINKAFSYAAGKSVDIRKAIS